MKRILLAELITAFAAGFEFSQSFVTKAMGIYCILFAG